MFIKIIFNKNNFYKWINYNNLFIREKGSNVNLIKNGDFEVKEVAPPEEIEDEPKEKIKPKISNSSKLSITKKLEEKLKRFLAEEGYED